MCELNSLITASHKQLTQEQEIKAHEEKNYDALICSQLALTYAVARQIARSIGRPDLLDDAFSIGVIRLAELVRIFDPKKGRLSTLCSMALKQRIRQRLSRLAEAGGVKQVRERKGKIESTGVACTYGKIVDRGYETVEDDLPELRELINRAGLDENQVIVLEMRCNGLSLAEIARQLNCPKASVHYVIKKAIKTISRTPNVKNCRLD
jgi:RNA polymerase sigma factor (sigma-70 family)